MDVEGKGREGEGGRGEGERRARGGKEGRKRMGGEHFRRYLMFMTDILADACVSACSCMWVCSDASVCEREHWETCRHYQHPSKHCQTLQHTAAHCNTLQQDLSALSTTQTIPSVASK